jgi:DNA-binding NtrC family response regulator
LVARAIHDFSERAPQPFIAVNCAGLTDTLLESELFGHVKGAFTGAQTDRAGLFEAAQGGTLFLDELAATSAAFQASLLRVLQAGEVRRVGATSTRRVNVRVIGASNAPLLRLVEAGRFRADLFYRLSVLTIDLPPLRARAGDIELLAQHFLHRMSTDGETPFRLSRAATEALRHHNFPGNVRELENALTRAAALSANRLITPECLPSHIVPNAALTCEAAPAPIDESQHLLADRPTLDELQRRYLQLTLTEARGNRRHAAKQLGVDRRTIQRLLARYKLAGAEDEAEEEDADDE